MARGGIRVRGSSVDEPNLYRDQSGTIFYRKQVKGELIRLSTGTTRVAEAVAWKEKHEEEQRGGRGDPWQQPLAPLAKRWIKELECGDDRRDMLERQIGTATDLLCLSITADLRDRAALKERLRRSTSGARRPSRRSRFR